jgi:plastocyanin
MTSGKARLVFFMLLASVLVISFATLSCGGGSEKSASPTAGTPPAQQASVQIKDFQFTPSKVTIKVGGTVTWTNEGSSVHTVTADDGNFDSGQLQKGKTFSRTFDSAGTFSYHCSIHPSMKAQVIVEE